MSIIIMLSSHYSTLCIHLVAFDAMWSVSGSALFALHMVFSAY